MSLATELQTVTAAEISAAFRAADMRRLRPGGYGLATALNTPCIERALRLLAVARRRAAAEAEALDLSATQAAGLPAYLAQEAA